jgi:hypothetical protein
MDSSFIQCPLPRNEVSLTNAFGILVVLCCVIFVTSPPAACLQADLFIAVRSLSWALFKIYCYKNSCRGQRVTERRNRLCKNADEQAVLSRKTTCICKICVS